MKYSWWKPNKQHVLININACVDQDGDFSLWYGGSIITNHVKKKVEQVIKAMGIWNMCKEKQSKSKQMNKILCKRSHYLLLHQKLLMLSVKTVFIYTYNLLWAEFSIRNVSDVLNLHEILLFIHSIKYFPYIYLHTIFPSTIACFITQKLLLLYHLTPPSPISRLKFHL